ncbi:hypothetical protein [Candidatus Pelagibacter sp. HIMB1509]|uniref:hypothetical protein n=1 Tax=Candidatus Pelagibacter sp. HIMB1509 TaxID=3413339 RepID=UPI003F82D395
MLINYFFLNLFLILIIIKFKELISEKLNLILHPNKKTFHKNKSYLLGGIILFQGYIINYFYVINNSDNHIYLSIFITFLFFLIAIIDDISDVSPYLKIIFCCFVSYLVIVNDITLTIKTLNLLSIGTLYFPDNIFIIIFFPILCLVIFVNAFNFIDGIDGLASLVGLSIFLYLISKNYTLLSTFFILLSSIIIFTFLNLKYNFFLGDSGNYIISITISTILIKENYLNPQLYYVEEIFLIMMLPGLDFIRLFFKRIKNNKNPLFGDLNHLHHLMYYKFGHIKTLIYYLIIVNLPLYIYLIFEINLYLILIVILTIYMYLIKKLSLKQYKAK